MIVLRKMTGLPVMALVLCLAGCLSGTPPDEEKAAFSYTADELATVFNTDTKTLTMNKWFQNLFISRGGTIDYDTWLQQGNSGLFEDEALTQKFLGSDLIRANTVIYSASSLNLQGPRIGTVSGTIRLTDIPSEEVKIYLSASGKNGKNWSSNGTVTGPVEENKDMAWSFPVYDTQTYSWGGTWGFEPSEADFTLLVLPKTAEKGYEVKGPAKRINNANENVGSLDTVNIKGVQLSGTINVTYKEQPVPCVVIIARRAMQETLEIIYLSSPEPNAPWSIFLNKSAINRQVSFQIFGKANQDDTENLFDVYTYLDNPLSAFNDVSNITIDLGNRGQ